jgi:hypothetical protein
MPQGSFILGIICWIALVCAAYDLYGAKMKEMLLPFSCHLPSYLIEIIYANVDDFQYGQVNLDKRPYDCDYDTVPLGNKHCHYEVTVRGAWRTGRNTERKPIFSTDNGKTWFEASYFNVSPALNLGGIR